MKRIPTSVWSKYKRIVNDFVNNDAGEQSFVWFRHVNIPIMFGEDSPQQYEPVELKGLFHYNYIRVWPYNVNTTSGTIDTTNVVLYITKDQLQTLGYINEGDYWDLDNVQDRFLLDGKVYKPAGDTPAAQANNDSLLFFIVLEIENQEDSNKLLKAYKDSKYKKLIVVTYNSKASVYDNSKSGYKPPNIIST